MSSQGKEKMKDNKTEIWNNAPPSARYELFQHCPKCRDFLLTVKIDIGIFPHIYTDVCQVCPTCQTNYNFCYPLHPIFREGLHIYDTMHLNPLYAIEEQLVDDLGNYKQDYPKCPFHQLTMKPNRYLGNITYSDGTEKVHVVCPICYYYERIQITRGFKNEKNHV